MNECAQMKILVIFRNEMMVSFLRMKFFDFQHMILKYISQGKILKLLQNCIFYSEINICFKYLDQNKLCNKFHEKANLFITLCMIMYYISCFFLFPFQLLYKICFMQEVPQVLYIRGNQHGKGVCMKIKEKSHPKDTPNTKLV